MSTAEQQADDVAYGQVHHRAAKGEEILRVENLVKYFPIRAGI